MCSFSFLSHSIVFKIIKNTMTNNMQKVIVNDVEKNAWFSMYKCIIHTKIG